MELTQKEYRKLVKDIALEVIRLSKKEEFDPDKEEWLTTEEAAAILHISPRTLRNNKDRYPHTKVGDKKQGQLRFLRKGLMENYTKG